MPEQIEEAVAAPEEAGLDAAQTKEEKKRIKTEKKRLAREMKELKKSSKEARQMETEEEDSGSAASVILITFFIVVIWLAILAMVIKLDVGGLGSNILAPLLKDVPVLNAILPAGATAEDGGEEGAEYYGYSSLEEAVEQIKQLQLQIDQLQTQETTDTDTEQALRDEIARLKTFEDSQVGFQKVKTEFYEDVVYNDNAPDISEYKKYYESIDPENAEYLYKQVVEQMQGDEILDEYVQAYSDMKPKQAAAIFEAMPDNLDLTAKILGAMDPGDRAKILGVMDAELASRITKLMDPDS